MWGREGGDSMLCHVFMIMWVCNGGVWIRV